jgi:uncharacterized tellurite resistance protein B-like protein
MLTKLKSLLLASDDTNDAKARDGENGLRLAITALLVEAACMDGQFDASERETITRLLINRFDLNQEDAETLIAEGHKAVSESHQLYGFTRVVKDRFSHQERIEMIEMLWEVVYADARLDDFEANLMRRIAGLIYVPDAECGQARKRVMQRLGIK